MTVDNLTKNVDKCITRKRPRITAHAIVRAASYFHLERSEASDKLYSLWFRARHIEPPQRIIEYRIKKGKPVSQKYFKYKNIVFVTQEYTNHFLVLTVIDSDIYPEWKNT